ncbi:MAG: polymer-forming cytoskeletal protein [Hyphomicrobiaceae bacterium]|nr:polymer-forming cytoskeletal protein [Hyphomicrobiaceae bacterium]
MLPNFKKPDSDLGKLPIGPTGSPSMPPPVAPIMQASASSARAGTPSIIGPDLVIVGNLVSKGDVQIDGEVQGDVHSNYVMIGEKARLTGSIIAEEVVIRGQVMGTIRSKRVVLQSTSRVEGDIHHSKLSIEQDAVFEGKSRRSEDPTAGVQRPEIGTMGGTSITG